MSTHFDLGPSATRTASARAGVPFRIFSRLTFNRGKPVGKPQGLPLFRSHLPPTFLGCVFSLKGLDEGSKSAWPLTFAACRHLFAESPTGFAFLFTTSPSHRETPCCPPPAAGSGRYAAFGSTRTFLAGAALGMASSRTPSLSLAFTFAVSTSAGRSSTRSS